MTALRWTLLIGLTGGLILFPALFQPLLRPFAPAGGPVIYDRASLAGLTASHLALVALAVAPSAVIALSLAIVVTRPAGAEFLPMARALVNIGQTFPPVAVLALSVPLLGFGARPTVLALFLYGLLPIFENALAGLRAVPGSVLLSGRAVGMTPRRMLVQVEIPLALPLILEGMRISVVVALSTATIGSTVAARSLGEVIIAGLTSNNPAYVIQGGVLTGCIAVLLYDAFGLLIALAKRRTGRTAGPH